MARQLRWSPEAVEDVEAIAQSIPDQPELGRVVPEIKNPDFRERVIHKYRVIYRIKPERILVVAVIHGSRQLEPLVGRIHSVQEI